MKTTSLVKKQLITAIAVVLVVACGVVLTMIPTLSAADEQQQAIQEQYGAVDNNGNASKQEVVYAKLSHDGTVQDTYVVNVFETKKELTITDYGAYEKALNLTTQDALLQTSQSITFKTNGSTFSYQGTLASCELPWNIAFHYYLDGNEVQPSNLAGKSGALEFVCDISQNAKADTSFFDNYVVQVTLTLPGDVAQDVTTEDGSIARSGSDTQISFMAMPESDTTVRMRATVQEFSLPSIQVAAVPLSLGLDLPSGNDISSQFDDLVQATNTLAKGTSALLEGSEAMDTGMLALTEGMAELSNSTSELALGIDEYAAGVEKAAQSANQLNEGSEQFAQQLDTLAKNGAAVNEQASGLKAQVSALKSVIGSSAFQAGYTAALQAQASGSSGGGDVGAGAGNASQNSPSENAAGGSGTDTSNESVAGGSDTDTSSASSDDTNTAGTTGTTSAPDATSSTTAIDTTETTKATSANDSAESASASGSSVMTYDQLLASLNGIESSLDGLAEYAAAVQQLSNAYSSQIASGNAGLSAGLTTLSTQAQTINEGTTNLALGTALMAVYSSLITLSSDTLTDATGELNSGAQTLARQTQGIPDSIQKQMDEYLSAYDTSDFTPHSFVSSKNTKVTLVQFVMATDAIEAPEKEEEAPVEEEESLVDRFFALFV